MQEEDLTLRNCRLNDCKFVAVHRSSLIYKQFKEIPLNSNKFGSI